jgi:type II secretory pathway pseudopilin PulG
MVKMSTDKHVKKTSSSHFTRELRAFLKEYRSENLNCQWYPPNDSRMVVIQYQNGHIGKMGSDCGRLAFLENSGKSKKI